MAKSKLKHLAPKQARDLMQDNPRAILIDIRSTMEYLFIGHPVNAIHIPWIDEPEWIVNPHFVTRVRELILGGVICDDDEGCAPIILICRSGKRSVKAGEELIKQGFSQVFNVLEGFEGELDNHHHRNTVGGFGYRNTQY